MTLDLKALREKYALLTGWGYQAEVLALIDELTEARRERDEAENALVAALASAPRSLATARAVAMEEFRKAACLCGPGLHYNVKPGECHVCKTASRLAPLEASLVAVPREALRDLNTPKPKDTCDRKMHRGRGRDLDDCDKCEADNEREREWFALQRKCAAALTALSVEVKP